MLHLIIDIALGLSAAALGFLLWRSPRVASHTVSRTIDPPGPLLDAKATNASLMRLGEGLATHARELADLKLAVAEGIQHAFRAEKRVQKTVASAKRLLAANGLEHAGLDAEASELADRDDGGSEEQWVQPVPEGVADNRQTGVPGVSMADLAALSEITLRS